MAYKQHRPTNLKAATTELQSLMEDESEVKISKMIQLLQITKTLNSDSDWSGDNEVSDSLIKLLRLFLVDRDKIVRTQGARAMKYITHNIDTLARLNKYNIPFFMSRCLEREDHKYLYERVQSLKWIRHIMELMDQNNTRHNVNLNGMPPSQTARSKVKFPRCLAQSLIAIASHSKDEFRSICLDTLRDLALKNVGVVSQCNGIKVIVDCILDSSLNDTSQSLLLTLLYILDHPNTRKHLRTSLDIQGLFAPFTELDPSKPNPQLNPQQVKQMKEQREMRRDIAIRTLMTILKSVTGILYIASDAYCLKSLVDLMKLPPSLEEILWARKAMFSVLEEILAPISDNKLDNARGPNLMVNYAGLILIAFIKNGLIEALVEVGLRHNIGLPERARALLCKIQLLSARYLPKALCAHISAIPKVINDAAMFSYGKKESIRYRSLLDMTVSRNFATNMLIELSEPAESDEAPYETSDLMQGPPLHAREQDNDTKSPRDKRASTINEHRMSRIDHSSSSHHHGKKQKAQRIIAQSICHRLGPSMDLNSTFIRYRYMMDRDIPTIMFQDRIPYHNHQQSSASTVQNNDFSQFSMRAQRSMILEGLKEDQNAASGTDINFSKTTVHMYKDFTLWDMDEVWRYLNGPLWHLPNLLVAMNKSKFVKRLVQYLKPSRQLFCQLKWSPDFFKHAQCACQLFRLLTSCQEGVEFQYFQELVSEIFNCLKDQLDANIRKRRPQLAYAPLSRTNVQTTLSRVYMVLIGILSESDRGIKFFKEHHMMAFLFPLTRKELTELNLKKPGMVGPNDYLLKLLAVNLDYTVDDNFRMLLSNLINTGSFYLKKYLISHLEVLYRAQMPQFDEWSINVLAVLLKQEPRLALTALKVLEKINLSQGSAKSRSYLVDLINTHPKDEVVGLYGQFLFIKMLSTIEGLRWLRKEQWLDRKRNEWKGQFNRRYTKMLEKALWLSVNNAPVSAMSSNGASAAAAEEAAASQSVTSPPGTAVSTPATPDDENKAASSATEEAIDWLPHHLIHEHKTDEEELYHEYLTHFPWILNITVRRPNGQEIDLTTDCFFDYNCFIPPRTGRRFPVSMGPGIHALVLDKLGIPRPFHVGKSDAVKISLNIGSMCLDSIYSKKSLEKWVKMGENMKRINHDCSIITIDQVTLFFQPAQTSDDPYGASAASQGGGGRGSLYKQASSSDMDGHGRASMSTDLKHTCLQRVFFSVKEIQKSHSLVRPLPHFYGELAKTTEGCNYIKSKGDLGDFVSKVNDCNDASLESEKANLELRASLWALGMIGSSVTGLSLLNETNVVNKVAHMAKHCQTLSVRGTCLYVLGLFSRTRTGMSQLSKYGFDFPADNLELDLAVAIPRNLDEFFQIDGRQNVLSLQNGSKAMEASDAIEEEPYEEEVKSWPCNDEENKISVHSPPQLARPMNMKPIDASELLGKPGHSEETVLAHISALCNNVTQKSSGGALHKLRQKKPTVFSNPLLLRECAKLLIAYNFKLPARRFVLFNLFDMCLLDASTMGVWDEPLSDAILPHKQIREWRYQYKKVMLEKKRAAQRSRQQKYASQNGSHGSRGTHGSHATAPNSGANSPMTPNVPKGAKNGSNGSSGNNGSKGGSGSNNNNINTNNSGAGANGTGSSGKYAKKPNFKQMSRVAEKSGDEPKKGSKIDKSSFQSARTSIAKFNSVLPKKPSNGANKRASGVAVQKSRSSTIKSDAAGLSPAGQPQDAPNAPATNPLPVIADSQSKITPSPPGPVAAAGGAGAGAGAGAGPAVVGNESKAQEQEAQTSGVKMDGIPSPPAPHPQTSVGSAASMEDEMGDDDDDEETQVVPAFATEVPDVPMTLPDRKGMMQHLNRGNNVGNVGGSLPHHKNVLPNRFGDEIADSPTKNVLGPNPLDAE